MCFGFKDIGFGMPVLKLILVDQSSNIQVIKKLSCRSTIASTTIPVDDSIKLVPLPSNDDNFQLHIAVSCQLFCASDQHTSPPNDRRTCNLQGICMRFDFLWSTQPIHEMMALSAETNWPLRKPLPNGTQRPGVWAMKPQFELGLDCVSLTFLPLGMHKKNWLKPSNMSTQKPRPCLVAQQMSMPYPVRLQNLWNPLPCWATSGCGWGGV